MISIDKIYYDYLKENEKYTTSRSDLGYDKSQSSSINRSQPSSIKSHKLFNDFFKTLTSYKLGSTLFVNNFDSFISEVITNGIPNCEFLDIFKDEAQDEETFETVINFFPWGYRTKDGKRADNFFVMQAIRLISDDGIGILYYPSYIFLQNSNLKLKLSNQGFFINSIINLPEKFNRPNTAVNGILVFISRVNTKYTYFAEFDEIEPNISQIEHVASEVIEQNNHDNKAIISGNEEQLQKNNIKELSKDGSDELDDYEDLWHGIHCNFDDFKSFEFFKAEREIRKLDSSYKDYDVLYLSDISSEVISSRPNSPESPGGGIIENRPNSIYIPLIKNHDCKLLLNEIELNSHDIIQVIVNTKFVEPVYLVNFLNSRHGIMMREGVMVGNALKRISLRNVKQMLIPVPSKDKQKEISKTFEKINKASEEFEILKKQLLLHPTSEKEIEKLDDIIESIGKLTESEKTKSLINKKDESKTLEFKETFGWDVKKSQQGKYLEDVCVKTLAGFFNADGGILLIGVSDKKEIIGIEVEIEKLHKNLDNFLKHMKNIFKHALGPQRYTLYNTKVIKIDGVNIIQIECKKSNEPVFTTSGKFYVRTVPATDELIGDNQHKYITEHFRYKQV